MHTKLLWSFIALSWPTTSTDDALTQYTNSFAQAAAGVTELHLAGPSPRSSFRMSYDEFTQFMAHRKAQYLQCKGKATHRDGEAHSSLLPGVMWSALIPLETGYSHPDKRRAFENCRMACLIFLNLVVADHGEKSQITREYFGMVEISIQDEGNDNILTTEHFLWALLSNTSPDNHYQRCWKLSRMIEIVKKVRISAWTEIDILLRLFLGYRCAEAEAFGRLRAWEGIRFFEEAMIDAQPR